MPSPSRVENLPRLLESKLAVRHADVCQSVRKQVLKNPGEQVVSFLDGCIKEGFHVVRASVFRLLLDKLHVVVSFQDGVLPAQIIFPWGEELNRERALESGACAHVFAEFFAVYERRYRDLEVIGYARLGFQSFAPDELNGLLHALRLQILKPHSKSGFLPRPPGMQFLVACRLDIYEVGVIGGEPLFAILHRALEIVRELGEGDVVGYVIVFFPGEVDATEDEDVEELLGGLPIDAGHGRRIQQNVFVSLAIFS